MAISKKDVEDVENAVLQTILHGQKIVKKIFRPKVDLVAAAADPNYEPERELIRIDETIAPCSTDLKIAWLRANSSKYASSRVKSGEPVNDAPATPEELRDKVRQLAIKQGIVKNV